MSSRSLGRNFHRLWAAAAVSNLGDGLRLVAFPLLAATITRDPGRLLVATWNIANLGLQERRDKDYRLIAGLAGLAVVCSLLFVHLLSKTQSAQSPDSGGDPDTVAAGLEGGQVKL